MKLTYMLLGVLLAMGQAAFAQELKEGYYPDGKLRYKGHFVNGEPAGVVTHYYSDGKVKAVMNHKGGKVEAVLYDPTGNFKTSGLYLNRKKNGVWEYRKGERLLLKEEYKDNRLDGMVTRYFPSGEVAEIRNWKEGRMSGDWKLFYENGKTRMEAPFVDGRLNGWMKSYAPDGKLRVEGEYGNDLKEGAWHFYDTEGKLRRTLKYQGGICESKEKEDLEESRRLDEQVGLGRKIPDPALFADDPENYMKLSGAQDKTE